MAGKAVLAHGNPTFGSQITAETLNQVIEEGPNKGKPVAFFLTGSPEGQAILARNNYLPDYLEKHQMIILCRLILLASVKKKVQTIILIEK